MCVVVTCFCLPKDVIQIYFVRVLFVSEFHQVVYTSKALRGSEIIRLRGYRYGYSRIDQTAKQSCRLCFRLSPFVDRKIDTRSWKLDW